MTGFRREDYEYTAQQMRSENETIVRAVTSNNHNIILSALDHCTASPLRPAIEQPIGGWFITCRDGEDGVNITSRIAEDEWADMIGRTTVTHHSMAKPTHYLLGNLGEVFKIAKTMRAHQKAWFKDHHQADLAMSKKTETALDLAILKIAS